MILPTESSPGRSSCLTQIPDIVRNNLRKGDTFFVSYFDPGPRCANKTDCYVVNWRRQWELFTDCTNGARVTTLPNARHLQLKPEHMLILEKNGEADGTYVLRADLTWSKVNPHGPLPGDDIRLFIDLYKVTTLDVEKQLTTDASDEYSKGVKDACQGILKALGLNL